jgi:hypothetical protein
MKISISLVAAIFLLMLNSCVKVEDLERANPYDESDGPNNAVFTLDSVLLVEESTASDGQLQSFEKIYFQVWIKNTGTQPGRFSNWFFEPEIDDALNVYPNQFFGDASGTTFIVDHWLEPGASMRLESGQISPGNIPYSIRVEKGVMAGSNSVLNMKLRFTNVHTNFYFDFLFPVDMF